MTQVRQYVAAADSDLGANALVDNGATDFFRFTGTNGAQGSWTAILAVSPGSDYMYIIAGV